MLKFNYDCILVLISKASILTKIQQNRIGHDK